MKTSTIKKALWPIFQLASIELEKHKVESYRQNACAERIKAEIDHLKAEMRKVAKRNDPGELEDLQTQLAEKNKELEQSESGPRRFLTSDATTEKLAELLATNESLLVYRDELAGWLALMDKPGRQGDRQFYLESWNGDSQYSIDRIGRGSSQVTLCLSIVGGIQPGKLASHIACAVNESTGADGLLQRLQLLVWPDSLGKWKNPTREPDSKERESAFSVVQCLADSADDKKILTFDRKAQQLADTWREELESRVRGSFLQEFAAFESHLSKYRSLFPSLALIFELLISHAGNYVTLKSARLAASWCDFLEAHARKIYADELRPGRQPAQELATRIKAGSVSDRAKVRDIYRKHWAGLTTATAVESALKVLIECNWVRLEQETNGGRPSDVIRIHPGLLEGESE